mmetsp:Transcript_7857/g.17550  ORF Transcript_7857/g.17550 Transcript_7857/m.17550 type:complete len:184 (-) Transcript_7857:107-658(-)
MDALEEFVALIFGEHKDTAKSLLGGAITVVLFATANTLINKFAGHNNNNNNSGSGRGRTKNNASSSNNNKTNSRQQRESSSSSSSSNTNNHNNNNRVRGMLLWFAAFASTHLYKTACSIPDFVDRIDALLDGCQSRLRERVAFTANDWDDSVLDFVDGILDAVQAMVRRRLRNAVEARGGGTA